MSDDSTKARGAIAILATLALIALIAALLYRAVPEGSRELLSVVVGALLGVVLDVRSFYFSSSSGAKALVAAQTETVKTLTEAVATSVPATAARMPDAEVDIDLTRRRSA